MSETQLDEQQSAAELVSPFVSTVAYFLRYGYALLPSSLRTDPSLTHDLQVACHSAATDEEQLVCEELCGKLVRGNAFTCFRITTEDRGVDALKATLEPQLMALFGATVTPVSILSYVGPLLARMKCPDDVVIIAMIYVARVAKRGVQFSARSCHRMFLAALLIATKVHQDVRFPYKYYAEAAATTTQRLCKLEVAMLKALDYNTFVEPLEFTAMVFSLRSCHRQLKFRASSASFGTWAEVSQNISLPEVPRAAPVQQAVPRPPVQPHPMATSTPFRTGALHHPLTATTLSSFGESPGCSTMAETDQEPPSRSPTIVSADPSGTFLLDLPAV